jgi:hypothetical protein
MNPCEQEIYQQKHKRTEVFQPPSQLHVYCSTLATLALIKLLVERLKISKTNLKNMIL